MLLNFLNNKNFYPVNAEALLFGTYEILRIPDLFGRKLNLIEEEILCKLKEVEYSSELF